MERKIWAILLMVTLTLMPSLGKGGWINKGTIPLVSATKRATEGIGNFLGEISYFVADPQTGMLILTIENTSPLANGGYITAIVFNNPENRIDSITLSSSNPYFSLIGLPDFDNRILASPFGFFDIGISLYGGSFEGFGNPDYGIAVGERETFIFYLSGNALDQLTIQNFVQENCLPLPSKKEEFFLVRFRGFNDGKSDKVPADVVPEPGSLFLLLVGGSAFVFIKKFKKKI